MGTKKARWGVDRTAHVYCDESGNSGPNLLDASQPVYVLGGWVVPRQFVPRAEDAVRNLADRVGLTGREIHGTRILRSPRGQREFTDFIRAMGKAGGAPVFNITEKRYWIAGKVVETYLDSFYNKRVPWEFYNDILAKQELAGEISQFHDEPLREFAAAYRAQDANRLERSALRFATLFELTGKPQLASWFRSSIDNLDDIARAERATNESLPARALGTVNVPVLASFLSLLESLSRYYGIEPVHIFHDESQEFVAGYKWAFNLYKGAKSNVELHLPNGRMIVFTFQCVDSITMVKSEECLLVQAADLLVSALGRYARHIVHGERPPEWLAETLDVTISATWLPAFGGMGTFGELMGSPRFLAEMVKGASLSIREGSAGADLGSSSASPYRLRRADSSDEP